MWGFWQPRHWKPDAALFRADWSIELGDVQRQIRARHTTTITLYRDSERLDVRNEIAANFSDVRHWSFSFNFAAPHVHTEEVGALVLN